MAVELPNGLVWVLDATGASWPAVDEDELRTVADDFRRVATDLADEQAGAQRSVQRMLAVNASESLDAFEALWGRVSGAHLRALSTGIKDLADSVSLCADVLEAAKSAAITELAAFAAECPAEPDGETAAASDASSAPAAATRAAVRHVLDQAIERIGRELREAMTARVVIPLDSAAEDLGTRLIGDVRASVPGTVSTTISTILGGSSPR